MSVHTFPCVMSFFLLQGEKEVVCNACPYLASLSQLSFLFTSRTVEKGVVLTRYLPFSCLVGFS